MPSYTSQAAAEGTAAHEVAADTLAYLDGPGDLVLGEIIKADGYEFPITEEMVDAVTQYWTEVTGELDNDPDGVIWVEQKFHLKKLHFGLFGTADAVVWLPKYSLLKVFDFKYGKGVPVDVKDNPQLRYYALGALLQSQHPAKFVESVIVQPRCPHPDGPVRYEQMHVSALLDWTDDLMRAVEATEDPDAQPVPGDWCRWCDAAPVCPALMEKAQQAAQMVFMPDNCYDEATLATALDMVPMMEAWCKSVRQFAFEEAQHGRATRGWKLVQKRATRKWIDESSTIDAILAIDDQINMFVPTKLLSPAQIQKALGKEQWALLGGNDLTVSESTGLTLAPESDNRDGVARDPQSVFKNEDK